jgi:hypothetical protein
MRFFVLSLLFGHCIIVHDMGGRLISIVTMELGVTHNFIS